METMKAIYTRRSIRKYTEAPISDNNVQTLLKAAMVAPSAFDERPWHFITIDDVTILKDLAGKMEGCEMLEEATLGMLICGDKNLEQFPGFWQQDCSACAQNVLLAAHELGLGACWIAIHPVPDREKVMVEAMQTPSHVVPFALISLGHPKEQLPGEDRFEAERVHRNRWTAG